MTPETKALVAEATRTHDPDCRTGPGCTVACRERWLSTPNLPPTPQALIDEAKRLDAAVTSTDAADLAEIRRNDPEYTPAPLTSLVVNYVTESDERGARDILIEDADDGPVASMEGEGPAPLALARMMAAAPRLLPALVAVVEQQARDVSDRDAVIARRDREIANLCAELRRANDIRAADITMIAAGDDVIEKRDGEIKRLRGLVEDVASGGLDALVHVGWVPPRRMEYAIRACVEAVKAWRP